MIKPQCSQEQALHDIEGHEMQIIFDNGVSRHLKFKKKGTLNCWFDLITWKGHLCINGDHGTYVFVRIDDMFEFFRRHHPVGIEPDEKLEINPGYWGQKLVASPPQDGSYEEFCFQRFKERVWDYFNEYWEDEEDDGYKGYHRMDIEERIFKYNENEQEYYTAVYGYEYNFDNTRRIFQFTDFFDGGGTTRFNFHYLWCLYAIVWGIEQYDSRWQEVPHGFK